MLFIIIGLIIFFILIRNTTNAPKPESENELKKQGFNSKEAKREARAQRQEQRSQVRTIKDAASTAKSTTKTLKKLLK